MSPETDGNQVTLSHSASSRYRTEFYMYLSRLLLVDLTEDDATFLTFLTPLTQIANSLISNLLLSGQFQCSPSIPSLFVSLLFLSIQSRFLYFLTSLTLLTRLSTPSSQVSFIYFCICHGISLPLTIMNLL